jgi:molybdate transport system regulatory protein
MRMSYKRAWGLVETMNRCFAEPLVTTARGGSAHGGAALTETGDAVLAAYQALVAGVEASETFRGLAVRTAR